jgi:hypothetical protein
MPDMSQRVGRKRLACGMMYGMWKKDRRQKREFGSFRCGHVDYWML